MIKIAIPINPITKKNHQQIVRNYRSRRPRIIQSNQYLQYERDCRYFMPHIKPPIDYPVNIKCLFYRDSNRRCDLTNLLEAIDDILVKYQVIADDNCNILVGHDGSRVYVDKKLPRTEIYIERMDI